MSSTKPTASATPFVHRHRLRLSQTDAGGVVFFAQSLVIAHDAWEAVLDEVGFSVARIIRDGTFALPIVEANTRLLRPMRVGDDVCVEVTLEKLGTSSIIVGSRLDVDGVTVGLCRTVHVCIDGQGRNAPLPETFRAALLARFGVDDGPTADRG